MTGFGRIFSVGTRCRAALLAALLIAPVGCANSKSDSGERPWTESFQQMGEAFRRENSGSGAYGASAKARDIERSLGVE